MTEKIWLRSVSSNFDTSKIRFILFRRDISFNDMKLYKYMFYRLYRLIDKDYEWATDMRTSTLISLAELGFIAFLIFKFSNGKLSSLGFGLILLLLRLPVCVLSIYLFIFKDAKELLSYCNIIDKKQKQRLNVQMYVVLLLLGGLIFFLYKI